MPPDPHYFFDASASRNIMIDKKIFWTSLQSDFTSFFL